MYSGILDVLGNGVHEKSPFVSDGINVDLLSIIDELGNDDRVKWGDVGGSREVVRKSGFGVDDIHRSTGENIGGSDENGIAEHRMSMP